MPTTIDVNEAGYALNVGGATGSIATGMINKVTITTPATGATLTIVDGKTFTASNTLTLSGTDGSTLNIGTGGTLAALAYVASVGAALGYTAANDASVIHITGNETKAGNLTLSGAVLFQNASNSTAAFVVKNLAGSDLISIDSTNRVFVAAADSFAVRVATGGTYMHNSGFLAWTNSSNASSAVADLVLRRDATAVLAQRDGTNAQTQRVYGTYTDASNYRRVQLNMSTAGVAELKPEGAGTGASGNVLHISGLPTSNPGPGILWNNGGSVAIGT